MVSVKVSIMVRVRVSVSILVGKKRGFGDGSPQNG